MQQWQFWGAIATPNAEVSPPHPKKNNMMIHTQKAE